MLFAALDIAALVVMGPLVALFHCGGSVGGWRERSDPEGTTTSNCSG
jgi:hypothetical protein